MHVLIFKCVGKSEKKVKGVFGPTIKINKIVTYILCEEYNTRY